MALVNEQAALNGRPPIGFVNPALYTIGGDASYGLSFHDITVGANNGFSAAPGYDLVTGWGTPSGQGLIDQLAGASALVTATEPVSRSVELGTSATLFATVINTGAPTLQNCGVSLLASAPVGLSLTFQTTDPATNQPVGTVNTPVAIAGSDGTQSFVIALSGTAALTIADLPLAFGCDGTAPAAVIPGVNTVDLALSATPVSDIIALAATASQNGIVDLTNGAGAFALATSNGGISGTITASLDFNGASLPVTATICQTDATGQCLASAASSVTLADFAAGATPTFSVFLAASGTVPSNPAVNRVFIRFRDAGGAERGATSVALQSS